MFAVFYDCFKKSINVYDLCLREPHAKQKNKTVWLEWGLFFFFFFFLSPHNPPPAPRIDMGFIWGLLEEWRGDAKNSGQMRGGASQLVFFNLVHVA